MGGEQELVFSLLVKVAVMASMASLLLRWSFAKRMLLRERRTIRQRLELGAFMGVAFAVCSLIRIFLGYTAAEIGLEGAFVAGLVGGYVTGAVTGGLSALPAFLNPQHEWIALPLLAGVGALGGLIRHFAPGPEEVWRFSPFFPFAISGWILGRITSPQGAFQLLLLGVCLFVEFLRTGLSRAFASRHWLFSIYPSDADLNPATIVLVYATTLICIAITLKIWNNTRTEWKLEEQQRLLMKARLVSLASQINPHFLFNTLNSVTSLIRSDGDTARRLIVKLSAILRRLLRKHEAFVPLRDELSFIDDYLSIEVVRFGDKLRIVREIDPSTLRSLVPSMLLQPIVENSIKHGISPKVGGGTIWLRSALGAGRLQLELEDDGVGIPLEQMPQIFQKGIGFSNVNERLSVLFGHDFSLTVEPGRQGGTLVRIQIPELENVADAGSDARELGRGEASAAEPAWRSG